MMPEEVGLDLAIYLVCFTLLYFAVLYFILLYYTLLCFDECGGSSGGVYAYILSFTCWSSNIYKSLIDSGRRSLPVMSSTTCNVR